MSNHRSWHGGAEVVPLPAGARVLLVGAHPDDETIGAGRLVAQHRGPVGAVVLSAGERCVVDPRLDGARLAARRLDEWRSAVSRLGAEPVETPRWPDADLDAHEAAMADLLYGLVTEVDVVVGVWRHDPHPDHRAVGRACATATGAAGLPFVEYAVWAPHWMTPDEVAGLGCRLAPTPTDPAAQVARERALAAYASQTESLLPGVEPVVPAAMLAHHHEQLVVLDRG